MFKKLIFVALLLLFAGSQMRALSCDLSCSLMTTSVNSHSANREMKMSHCHSMAIDCDKTVGFSSSDSCHSIGCESGLPAMVRNGEQKGADAANLLDATLALWADSSEITPFHRMTFVASLSRKSDNRPVAVRPDSSLRI
jgi:hypothetical protein